MGKGHFWSIIGMMMTKTCNIGSQVQGHTTPNPKPMKISHSKRRTAPEKRRVKWPVTPSCQSNRQFHPWHPTGQGPSRHIYHSANLRVYQFLPSTSLEYSILETCSAACSFSRLQTTVYCASLEPHDSVSKTMWAVWSFYSLKYKFLLFWISVFPFYRSIDKTLIDKDNQC